MSYDINLKPEKTPGNRPSPPAGTRMTNSVLHREVTTGGSCSAFAYRILSHDEHTYSPRGGACRRSTTFLEGLLAKKHRSQPFLIPRWLGPFVFPPRFVSLSSRSNLATHTK